MLKRVVCVLLVAMCGWTAGCDSPEAAFRLDRVYLIKTIVPDAVSDTDRMDSQKRAKLEQQLQGLEAQAANLKDVMVALFGTPDEPHIPQLAETDTSAVMDEGLIRMAAGPVGRYEDGSARGLYREHCAHCHGVNGDGAGPTAAFLNPYPRDYRMGKFKFKSTPLGVKPTHDDLRRILINGIPDTAMPSFRLLADDEIDALVDYVKYLAIRGEVERRLVGLLTEVNEGEPLIDPEARREAAEAFEEQKTAIVEIVGLVVGQWANAGSNLTEVPSPPEDWLSEESVKHGRELFFGTVANCVKCHGQLAVGDGETGDFDDWTKEIDEKTPAVKAPKFVELGVQEPRVLDPRPIRPRNLRSGVYRGGRRPVDLFLRVKNGIEGTPMPAAPASGLSPEDIWRIVAYVRSLPREPISRPEGYQVDYSRERM